MIFVQEYLVETSASGEMTSTAIKATLFELELDDDGILQLRWERHAIITSADAEQAMDMVNELCGESEYPLLVDMATTATVTRDARLMFTRTCKATPIALLGASPVDRVLANYVMALDTTNKPKRFFTSRTEATAWLSRENWAS